MKGKFIVIEGPDGSGKSVQVELLAAFLKSRGKEVLMRNEPTSDLPTGQAIRKVLRGEMVMEPMARQELYVQDRTYHLRTIVQPALEKGMFVVCSRYFFSTIAYGYADGLDIRKLMAMNSYFLIPDFTIVIAVSADVCIRRLESRGQARELFERKEKLEKVNEMYQRLLGMFGRIAAVDGERPIESVAGEIRRIVEKEIL